MVITINIFFSIARDLKKLMEKYLRVQILLKTGLQLFEIFNNYRDTLFIILCSNF